MALVSAADDLAVYNGANAAFVGRAGQWEVIQYRDVEDNGDGTWTLTTLLRGRAGTSRHMDSLAAGAMFVAFPLNAAGVDNVFVDGTLVGGSLFTTGVSLGLPANSAFVRADDYTGERMRPWEVAWLEGERQGNDDIEVVWLRTERHSNGWRNGGDVPVIDTRHYEITTYVPGTTTVLGTHEVVDVETFDYTTALQVADGFTAGDPVEFHVRRQGDAMLYGQPTTVVVT